MSLSQEELKSQYIQTVEAEYQPAEQSWWQHPAPLYRLTSHYAPVYDKALISDEPVLFKKTGKERMVITVLFVVAALLLYLVGKNDFGLTHVLILLVLLIVILPILLYNKIVIRIDRESIWLQTEDKSIPWKQVLLTYIKETREEHSRYSFIVHYYDESTGEFRRSEIELDGLVSPRALSETIEAYRHSSLEAG